MAHSAFGKGIECKVRATEVTLSESFWGTKFMSTQDYYLDISAEQCWLMALSKECYGEKMSCDSSYCSFHPNFTKDYNWMVEKTTIYHTCEVFTKPILAEDENALIFNADCNIRNLQCKMHSSIVVWNKDVIHSCPYYVVGSGTCKMDDNWYECTINATSRQVNMIFAITSKLLSICGDACVDTAEGYLICKDIKGMSRTEVKDAKAATNAMLEEIDRTSLGN
jgi:hypothetical protein